MSRMNSIKWIMSDHCIKTLENYEEWYARKAKEGDTEACDYIINVAMKDPIEFLRDECCIDYTPIALRHKEYKKREQMEFEF